MIVSDIGCKTAFTIAIGYTIVHPLYPSYVQLWYWLLGVS